MPRFEARGAHVFKLPEDQPQPDGSVSVSQGFRVLSVSEYITDGAEVAAAIARVMNLHAADFDDAKDKACWYCQGKGKQFEALSMEVERCLYCRGTGRVPLDFKQPETK